MFRKIYFLTLTFTLILPACLPVGKLQVGIEPNADETEIIVHTETMTPSETPAPAVPEKITAVPTPTAESFPGISNTFEHLSLVIPPGLASGASGTEKPRAQGEETPPWGIAPEHIYLNLDGYILQDTFHQPRIFVYPAADFAALNAAVNENINFLQNAIDNPDLPLTRETLPVIPFFNAGPVFTSNAQVISFQNGQGVRFLTEYAQYFAFVNNTDLFYQYQGLTEDGQYYVIAILPITTSVLPPDADPQKTIPPGGIAQPDRDAPNIDWGGYYDDIAALLENTPAGDFSPTIEQLDALIRSIEIAP